MGMKSDQDKRGHSFPLDFDSLIGSDPEVRRAAEDAEIVASVGELVRRLRTSKAVTQSELARRTGMTQAHISELERGLGPNGPTVITLARIISELGEKLVFDTASVSGREAV
jgi:ribosome-binding protein aMBF1 (putative translation factor)